MQNAVHPTPIWADLAEMTHSLEGHFGLSRLKRGMLAMLAGWLGYFVVGSMSGRAPPAGEDGRTPDPGALTAPSRRASIFGEGPARISADRASPRPDRVPMPGPYARLPMNCMSTSRRCGRKRCSAT